MSAECCIPCGYRKVTHCIFDMDGLLLDTERLYTEVTKKILSTYGKSFSYDIKLAVMGLQNQQAAEKIVEAYDLPITWEEYSRLQREHCEEIMPNAELKPDTESVYEEIARQIVSKFNRTYTRDIRLKVLGVSEQQAALTIIKELKIPLTMNEYLKEYQKLSSKMLVEVKMKKGSQRLLRHLYAHNIPMALATSSGEPAVELKTRNWCETFDMFCHKVCGSTDPEVKEGKPAPDIFLIAAKRFCPQPHPSSCLVFEDAPNGVKAAFAAGMQCVMVPESHVPNEMRCGTQVLNSLEDFKPEDFGLPPYPSNKSY